MSKVISFIGMPYVGKTTIGKIVSKKISVDCYDLDEMLIKPKAISDLGEKGIKNLFNNRKPLYRKYASHVIDCYLKSKDEIVDEVIKFIK